MNHQPYFLEQTLLLIQRLERISADSIWARRASGLRGNLLKWVEKLEGSSSQSPIPESEMIILQTLLQAGFKILEKAAIERLR